jgi:hypothetical protein
MRTAQLCTSLATAARELIIRSANLQRQTGPESVDAGETVLFCSFIWIELRNLYLR